MKYRLTVVLIILAAAGLSGKSIWQDKNIYTSGADLRVGNVMVINVNDLSSMKFNLTLNNKTTSNVTSNPDAVITGFLPKIASDKKISNDDRTQFSGKGQIVFAIAVRVLNRVGAGLYEVSGSKTYTVNGVANIITVNGIIDPALVKGRAISSARVADFSMEIRGIKTGITLQRDLLKKDEKATSNLTEQEKQQIINDYLQKMLRELSR